MTPSLDRFDRFPLLEGPTLIQRLTRLEQVLDRAAGGARPFACRDALVGDDRAAEGLWA